MQTEQLIKAFAATVQASRHGLQALELALLEEQTALVGKDPQRLEDIVHRKIALLQQLEPSVEARDSLQGTANLPKGSEGGDRLIEVLGEERLADDWRELRSLAQRVAELNDHNSRLASQGQRTTREALALLTGRRVNEDTYSTLRRKVGGLAGYSLGRV